MVFFQNTSQKCWLTNGLRNLAIALWLIFKKKKQWNKTMFWGQHLKIFFFYFYSSSLASFLLLSAAFAGLFLSPGSDVAVGMAQQQSLILQEGFLGP